MKAMVDLARNDPDFIIECDGARIQDPRFVLFKRVSLFRYLWIKLVIWCYDACKDWLRKQEDLEAGAGFDFPRKERFWKRYWAGAKR
jgi:hypothetical protein